MVWSCSFSFGGDFFEKNCAWVTVINTSVRIFPTVGNQVRKAEGFKSSDSGFAFDILAVLSYGPILEI